MAASKRIAALVGPTLVAVTITEWVNLDVFLKAIGPAFGPHVYLNGALLFVAGLAIVQAHNLWSMRWPVLITLVGWFLLFAGLGRMAVPVAAQAAAETPIIPAALLGGCASLYTVSSYPPPIYGGVRLDSRVIGSAWSRGAMTCGLPYCSGNNVFLYYPGAATDLPFSLVGDTALLPYTLLANAVAANQAATPTDTQAASPTPQSR